MTSNVSFVFCITLEHAWDMKIPGYILENKVAVTNVNGTNTEGASLPLSKLRPRVSTLQQCCCSPSTKSWTEEETQRWCFKIFEACRVGKQLMSHFVYRIRKSVIGKSWTLCHRTHVFTWATHMIPRRLASLQMPVTIK